MANKNPQQVKERREHIKDVISNGTEAAIKYHKGRIAVLKNLQSNGKTGTVVTVKVLSKELFLSEETIYKEAAK